MAQLLRAPAVPAARFSYQHSHEGSQLTIILVLGDYNAHFRLPQILYSYGTRAYLQARTHTFK